MLEKREQRKCKDVELTKILQVMENLVGVVKHRTDENDHCMGLSQTIQNGTSTS